MTTKPANRRYPIHVTFFTRNGTVKIPPIFFAAVL